MLAQLMKLPLEAILEIHEHLLMQKSLKQDDFDYVTGGSSCGSAAAVAHGSSLISLGSDTGGSVRLPAAWCGLVGYKPTYGLLSRHGLVAYASSLDTVGVVATSVHCASVALDCLLQDRWPRSKSETEPPLVTITDSTQTWPPSDLYLNLRQFSEADPPWDKKKHDGSTSPSLSLAGIRVGIPAAFVVSEFPDNVTQAWDQAASYLETRGAVVEMVGCNHISPKVVQQSLAAYYILACAEASSNLARYDGFRYGNAACEHGLAQILAREADKGEDASTLPSLLEQQYAAARTTGFGPEVQQRVLLGTSVLSSDRFHTHYEAAAKVRALLTHQLHKVFDSYDVLLVPTCVSTAPPKLYSNSNNINGDNQGLLHLDATEMLANDVMTVPFGLAGLPAISVPFAKHASCSTSDHARTSQLSSSSAGLIEEPRSLFCPGLQLVAGRHGEVILMQVAAVLQEASTE